MGRSRELAELASAYDGSSLQFRNRIINGDMRVWQRYTGSAIGEGFLADRFNCYIVSGSSFLQDRYTLTDAQRAVIGFDARYALSLYTDASTSVRALQPIEGVNTLAGQTATVSFWAFTDTGTCTISALASQNFGSGGSPSAAVDTSITLSTTSIGTTPVKVTGTVSIPSISGKTLGTSGNDYLGLQIQKVTGHAGSLRITEIQFEPGSVATPFERRDYGRELAMCQRYYYENPAAVGTGLGLNLFARATALHPVEMRAAPSVTIANTAQFFNGGATVTCTGALTNYSTTRMFNADITIGGGGVTGYATCMVQPATGKITVSAEL